MVDFVEPMLRKDIAACQMLVSQLKKQLPNETTAWEQPLISILKGIKQNYHHESLLAILKDLPFEVNEALYSKILHPETPFPCLKTLVEHINSISLEKKQETRTLTTLLLTSPLPIDEEAEAQQLLLKLNGRQQGELLIKLRKQGDLINTNDSTVSVQQKKIAQISQKNYQHLLSFLTIQSFRNETTKLLALGDNPVLANLLMSNMFERTHNGDQQKKLVHDVLQDSKNYNWEDARFLEVIYPRLVIVFSHLSAEELTKHLKLYMGIARKYSKVLEKQVPLLDAVYAVTKDSKTISDSLAANDGDHAQIMDFLTRSKTNDATLRQTCLKKIDANHLAMFAGHMMALSQTGSELFTDYIQVVCNHLKSHQQPQQLCEELAAAIIIFPIKEKQLAIQTTTAHLATPELIQLFLHYLLLLNDNKTLLIPYLLKFIETYPDKMSLIVKLVKELNSGDLLTLYLQMLTQGFAKKTYNFFKELFKNPDQQACLIHILNQTPAVNPDLLNEFMGQLDDLTLMKLLGELLVTSQKNSEFKTTVNQVLVVFCQRLYEKPPEAAINEWTKQSFAKQIIDGLLDNPECIFNLSQTSTINAWAKWTHAGLALKYRIDAVLNYSALDPVHINQIALNWLEYFRTQPEQLHTVLNNLQLSAANRNAIGQANLLEIKRACWNLIKPGTHFNDEEFLKLFHSAKPTLFDPLLQHLAEEQYLKQDPHHGSIWLAKTHGGFPKEIKPELLVTFLIHSVHDNTLANWKKAAEWLEVCDAEHRLEVVKRLLDKVISSNNNPILDHFVYELITNCTHFNTFFPQLNESAWCWLLKNSNPAQLSQRASNWIDLISAAHALSKINMGKILALLPADHALINQILKKPAIKEPAIITSIFLQLSSEPDAQSLFIGLHEILSSQNKTTITKFLNSVMSQLKPKGLNINALDLLNKLIIMNADEFIAEQAEDQTLISEHLKLVNAVINESDANKQSPELKQLLINVIHKLVTKNKPWSEFICGTPAFTETALAWINTNASEPLITILVTAKALNLNHELKNNALFQKLLIGILITPSPQISSERFITLFGLLSTANKTKVATQTFEQPNLVAVQEQSVELIAASLSPRELLQLLEKNPKATHLTRALLTHSKGLASLSATERKTTFDSISSSAQLLDLLNDNASVASRVLLVRELFNCYGQDLTPLSKKLGQWLITAEALATLANFTLDKAHQELLNKLIKEKPYYQEYLYECLQHPDKNMLLNENSVLYHIAQKMLNTVSAKPYKTTLMEQLSLDDGFTALKTQLNVNHELQVLNSFFRPFLTVEIKGAHLLYSARWHHRLILMQGLLAAEHFYTENKRAPSTRKIIEQTALYKNCLLPLENNPLQPGLDITLLNRLFTDLQSYCEALITLNVNHALLIQNILNQYQLQLDVLQHNAAPPLYDYFRPESAIANLDSSGVTKLTGDQHAQLVKAHDLHMHWLAQHNLKPEIRFTKLLETFFKKCLATQTEECQQWIFQSALFSSLTTNLDAGLLKTYLGQIEPEKVSALILQFSEKIKKVSVLSQYIKELKTSQPLVEVVKQLSFNEQEVLTQLIEAAESLNLMVLKNLLCLAMHIKINRLDEERLTPLFLSLFFSEELKTNWLQLDLDLIPARIAQIVARQEQLITLGFGCHTDSQNELRLRHLRTEKVSPAVLINCLNSYGSSLSTQPGTHQEFFSILNAAMVDHKSTEEIIKGFEPQVTTQVILAAIQDPCTSSNFLERLIQSSCKDAVVAQLQSGLNGLIKQGKDPEPTNISELSAEQLSALPLEKLHNILAMQRLIYVAKPPPELSSFITCVEAADKNHERQLFAADACLYITLFNLEKKSGLSRAKYTSWMAHNCQDHFKTYTAILDAAVPDKEMHYPKANYYWLCWKSFMLSQSQGNPNTLIEGLLRWLKRLTENQLQNAPELYLLLQHIADQTLLTTLFKNTLIKNWDLSAPQIAWLCESSLKIAPTDLSILPYIIKLSSWSWLESYMKKDGPMEFELLDIAMENQDYLKSINTNEASQLNFISRLGSSKFTFPQLLSLVSKVTNNKVRTLIITHILSQKELLNSFKGDSIVNQLTINDVHTPSRLNSLVHQLELKTLTPAMIAMLQPEAAVSIICSVPHFHCFTPELIESLLGVYPEKTVISYWIHHYALMPNAHFTLAHLLKSADTHILPILEAMEPTKKETMVSKIIENLDLFNPTPKIVFEENEENRLILALRLVQNGHQHKSYVTLVTRLMDKLLSKNHPFSLEAIQLIIALNSKSEFSDLNNKTAYIANHYLRSKAQMGDVGLFYDAGQINLSAMNQTVQLKAPMPNQPSATKEVLSTILGKKTVIPNVQASTANIPENPLVNELKENKKSVTSFEYFLMHFKGNIALVKKTIQEFVTHHTQEGTPETKRQSIDHLSYLITKKEVELPIKEAIFATLLQYPELYDEQISSCLCIFDAQRTIQHFGLKGGEKNYRRVISLCEAALKKLDSGQHSTIIAIAKQAQSEAQLELTFNEERGFFANLFRRLKRCWISGWTGFFSPNLPVYVAPATSIFKQEPEKKTEPEPNKVTTAGKAAPDLAAVSKELKTQISIEKLDEIIPLLKSFSLQAKPRDENEIRLSLHEVYKQLLAGRATNKSWDSWLTKNQQSFINNNIRLFELKLIKGDGTELSKLIKETNGDDPNLNKIITEFTVSLPEQKPVVNEEKSAAPQEPDLVQTTVKLASDALRWASGFFPTINPLGNPSAPSVAASVTATNP